MNLVTKAAMFAQQKHAGQTRKGHEEGQPYFNHLKRVAQKVQSRKYATPQMVAAAYLHDILEDCGVTFEELVARFDEETADLVRQLTNTSKSASGNLTRAERKQLDVKRVSTITPEAKVIKLCDRIDNLRSGGPGIPTYKEESRELLQVLRNIDSELEYELETLVSCIGG